jgi:methylphosphotriester-DNA--protein-cysteine methyltransferase
MVHRAELLHQDHFASYYQQIRPPESLLPWVDHYWFLNTYEALGDDVSECHFPRLASEWVFTQSHSHFQGLERLPLSRLTHFVYPRQTFALGVRFQPGVHFSLAEGTEFVQTRLQADFSLVGQIKTSAFFTQQVEHLNHYFKTLLCQNPVSPTFMERLGVCQQALKAFEQPEQGSVNEVANYLGVTPRTLRRYFQAVLLMSPKSAQRQVRLRQALNAQWQSERSHTHPLLNYYTDTAHFYKTFRQICQVSLQQFSARYSV